MTTLSEQEKKARNEAMVDYFSEGNEMTIAKSQSFKAGFQAGLTYNKARIEELEGLLKVALEEAYQNEIVDTGMEHNIGENGDYVDKDDWLQGKLAEWDELRLSK